MMRQSIRVVGLMLAVVSVSVLYMSTGGPPAHAGATTASVAPDVAAVVDDGRIVPGSRIGSISLSINRRTVEGLNVTAGCPVEAVYDTMDRAMRLVTSTGGACAVDDDIQVGFGLEPVLVKLGMPDQITEDAHYPHATAFWLGYSGRGIEFRVLVMHDNSTIIQAIAIFPEARSAARRACPPRICAQAAGP